MIKELINELKEVLEPGNECFTIHITWNGFIEIELEWISDEELKAIKELMESKGVKFSHIKARDWKLFVVFEEVDSDD